MMGPRAAVSLGLAFVAVGFVRAEPTSAERSNVVGQPTSLRIEPSEIAFDGSRDRRQVIVTGMYADGTIRDLTPFADYRIDGPIATVDPDGLIAPAADGEGRLTVSAGGTSATAAIRVSGFAREIPVSFRNEVIPALSVGGCNSGACHGTPNGRNGFKLSLRGFDPDADFVHLTRDGAGRRADRHGDASLVLLKGLGKIPHEGGSRFPASSVAAQALTRWLAEGLRDDAPSMPRLTRIEVVPGARRLTAPARWQQLAVVAHFADGASRDVTRLSVFTSSDENVARVSPTGLVEFGRSGEVAVTVRHQMELVPVRIVYLEPKPGFVWPDPPSNNFVDDHVFAKHKSLDIRPSELCTDQEFLRRAYLDICGILPTADEVKAFLSSDEPNRRARLIDELLERPEYADFWTLKWSDIFRASRKTLQPKGVKAFQAWLRGHMERGSPLDEVVREVMTAQGSTFSTPAAGYFRVARNPESLAETTAQLFFGIRLQCAKCHNHPFERWSQDDYYGMAAWFARVKLKPDPKEPGDKKKQGGDEIVSVATTGEVVHPRTGQPAPPRLLGLLGPASFPAGQDRRETLAVWMTSADNPFVPRSIVNRVWFHLMGRGIVDPVDDFRDSNPSASDELLDALARDFVAHKWDQKHLIRVIVNSRTYQLSAQTNDFNKDDDKYFSHAATRLLTAEQLLDAISFVTDRPEAFKGHPVGTRAAQLPDGEPNHPFLKAFGQPARELACECERESESTLAQALQLINGAVVNDRLRDPANRIGRLLSAKTPEPEMLTTLFLVTLTRPPTDVESRVLLGHVAAASDKRNAWEDVHWSLINSKEFLFRH